MRWRATKEHSSCRLEIWRKEVLHMAMGALQLMHKCTGRTSTATVTPPGATLHREGYDQVPLNTVTHFI